MGFMMRDFRWVDTWDNDILNLFYAAVVLHEMSCILERIHENRLASNLLFSTLPFSVMTSIYPLRSSLRESGVSEPTPNN
jgi:hypothetical protein